MATTINKQLATKQDLAIGFGKVTQERNGKEVELDKIDFISAKDVPLAFATRLTMISNAVNKGASLGSILSTESALGTGHGGWTYKVTEDTPNGLNKLDLGSGLTATACLTGGVMPAGAYGAVLDDVTDDFNALTALHDANLSYTLEGKTAYCTGTLEPKTGQTIYPNGGGMRKDTSGYLFSADDVVDRFIIAKGGLFLGENVSDFLNMGGAPGYGNAWTNCEIDIVGKLFNKGIRMSNARRCEIRGRLSANQGIDYVNKSAECLIDGLNLVQTGAFEGSYGLKTDDEGDGYPEGLVWSYGLLFNFQKNLILREFFELNFNSVEFAASAGTYETAGHQIDVKAGTGGFARGLYFDANCHFSTRGIQFGDGTDVAPHLYDCVVHGSFRSQIPGQTISIKFFQHAIHIADGTLFRTEGSPGTRVAVVAAGQNQTITVGAIKCSGYDSYVQFKGAGALNSVTDIPNISNVSPYPTFAEYGVNNSNLQGLSGIIAAEKIQNDTYNTGVVKTLNVNLGEGIYTIRTSLVCTIGTSGTIALNAEPTGSGTIDVANGSGWSSVFRFVTVGELFVDRITFITVLKAGNFDIVFENVNAVLTSSGFHDFLSIERVT